MKKAALSLFSVLAACLLVLGAGLLINAEDVIHTGTSEHLTWSFNETTGELTVSGSGVLNYSDSRWSSYRDAVKKLTVQEGITELGTDAICFPNLESLSFPDSLTKIGKASFCHCSKLKDLVIPAGVTHIIDGFFVNTVALESITVEAGNTEYYSEGNCLIQTVGRTVMLGCKNSVIPNDGSIWEIGERAFAGNSELKQIAIPNSLRRIYPYAFLNCSSLESIQFPKELEWIGDHAFEGCSSLKSVTVPDRVEVINKYAFANCVSLESVTVGKNVRRVDVLAFHGCASLTELVFPDGLQFISTHAFLDCTSLRYVSLPGSLKQVAENAFGNCSALEGVVYCGTPEQWAQVGEGVDLPQAVLFYHLYGQDWQADGADQHKGVCEICGVVGWQAHDFVWTREDKDVHRGTCSVCSYQCTDTHMWNKGRVTEEPTHLSDGVRNATCTVCGESRDFVMKKISEHSYGAFTEHDKAQHQRACPCGMVQYQDHVYAEGAKVCSVCNAPKAQGCGATLSGWLAIPLLCSAAAVTVRRKKRGK